MVSIIFQERTMLARLALSATAIVIAASLGMSAPIRAATVDVMTRASATNFTAGAIPSDSVFDDDDASGSGNQTFVSATSQATNGGPLGAGVSTSFASANSVTGELKASSFGSLTLAPGVGGGPGVAGFAQAEIGETFVLNGTGTLILNMLVDVTWNQPEGGFQGTGEVRLGPVNQDFLSIGGTDGTAGSVDDVALSVSTPFTNAVNQSIDGAWILRVQRGDQPGFVDATNTATLWFQTTGSLVATPSSDTFLSNAAYPDDLANVDPNVIPLLASAWLLIGGIAGLGLLRRRQQSV
jgi:hypothetical protein